MRYFVIGDDGQKYGPADIPTLNAWISEGRLLPNQQLEDEASGVRTAASAVAGLNFPGPAAQPYAASNPYQQNYARPQTGTGYSGDLGQKDLTTAWILFGVGFVCCGIILWPIGIVYANKAQQAGNPGANAAKIANIVMTVIGAIGFVFYIIVFISAMGKGMQGAPLR